MKRGGIPDFRKEIAGGVAAMGVLAGGLAVGIPVMFAGAAAAAGFWAAWVLFPGKPESHQIVVAPGVNQEALEAFLEDSTAAVERIEKVRGALAGSALRKDLDDLGVILRRILDECREDPADIRVEPQLPALLAMLASMLERYQDVAPRALPNPAARAQLVQIEDAVRTSIKWLAQLEQRMIHDDIMDGTAQAQTLMQVMKSQLEDDVPPAEEPK